jgi:tetratricopeptide (TPR) repeat protein
MAGRLLDTDPERAYEHAQAAAHRGGRVDVVREAAGLAAYRTGRYAEALRELRTVRRLNGSSEHLAIMADCERGLGRPERAVALAGSPEAEDLDPESRIELAIVLSGARLDLGEVEAAIAALSEPVVFEASGVVAARVAQARAVALEAAGRLEEAATLLGGFTADQLADASGDVEEDDEIVVYDLEADGDSDDDSSEAGAADGGTGGASIGEDGAVGPVDVESGMVPREVIAPAEVADGEGEA